MTVNIDAISREDCGVTNVSTDTKIDVGDEHASH
jgi:hypothetical protein